MIRHFQKDCNRKNPSTVREKILTHVAKYPRYPRDLYDACARGSTLTRAKFRDLLDEMESDGEIRINANNLVHLPKSPPELKASPTEIPASTDVAENRTEPANMTVDEILEHCMQRAQTKAGDCLTPVERDAHIDNRSRGIYQISHSRNKKVRTSDFERAGFSLMPTKKDGNPIPKYGKYWNTRRKARDWGHDTWRNAYGIKIFTGKASRKIIDGTAYYPICWDIEEGLLLEHPDVFKKIVHWAITIPNASLMISKSGGLRINAWCPFVWEKHLQMVARREWIDENGKIKGITYAEILSGKGLARIDERYLLAKGRIDEFPVLTESEFIKPLEWVEPLDDRICKRAETDKVEARAAESRKRKQEARAAMGYTERAGEIPLEALAKSDPSQFLGSLDLEYKTQSGQYYRWGRPEKPDDIALSVWQSAQGNWQIRVFANSIPIPPSVAGAMPLTRFFCYHELNTDIEGLQPDSQQWKDINAELARLGYGTWLTDKEFNAQNASKKNRSYTSHIRLSVSEHDRETQEIEAQAGKISAKFCEWEKRTRNSKKQHLLNVTTAAGTRKTTVAVHHYPATVYIAKTKEEADQAFTIADRLGRNAWRHRPRMYNRDNDAWHLLPLGLASNQRPCIHPETCNTLAQRGHAPAIAFCQERCEVYSSCRQKGFLAQTEIERKKQDVLLSWNEAFFSDEHFRLRVRRVLNKEKMLILDEADPAGLPQHRQIDLNELPRLLEAWRLPDQKALPVFFFLETLIQRLSTTKDPEQIRDAIRECIKDVTADEIQEIDDALSKIPLGVVWQKSETHGLEAVLIYGNEERRVCVSDTRKPPKGYDGTIPEFFAQNGVAINKFQLLTVSLDVFDRAGFLHISKDPEKAPRRFTTLLNDLKTFAESNSTACHRTKSMIEFFLPPGLNAPRGITLTASDKDDLIREVYRGTDIEVETLTGLPPPFQPGCKYFQIATGRYTTKKALLKKEDGVFTGIQPFYRRCLDAILKIAERHNVLVVAPKDALNAKLDARIERLHTHPNIEAINHHHAEGRNDFQHCDVVILFHFEPHPDEIKRKSRRVYRNQNLSFDREIIDIVVDGVKLAGVMRYTDERVQKVYNRECESRHMQSFMRLRPMINPDKLLISLSAEPVSRIPIAPVPFILSELETYILDEDGDLAEFDAYLEKNATRSVKDIAEQDGVSKRTAYRKTEKHRSDTRAETEKQVLELADQGLSQRKIKDKLGISLGKVQGILKKHKHKVT